MYVNKKNIILKMKKKHKINSHRHVFVMNKVNNSWLVTAQQIYY